MSCHASVALLIGACALVAPAVARAAPAHTLGEPVATHAGVGTIPGCAAADQHDWVYLHLTPPFAAPYAGGVVRLTVNRPVGFFESHPALWTDEPLGLADLVQPAGTVLWSPAEPADDTGQVALWFVCAAQGATAFDVGMDFYPTPAAPVTYAGHGARGQWSLLELRLDQDSAVTLTAGGAPLAYRLDDPDPAGQGLAPPGAAVALGAARAGQHALWVMVQTDVASDWTAAIDTVVLPPTVTPAAPSVGGPAPGEGPVAAQPIGPAVPLARPVLRRRPWVVGVARVGRTLRCARGTYTGAARYAVAWLRDGRPLAGRTGVAYRLRRADRGHVVACRVRATNAAGTLTARSAGVRVRRALP